MSKRLKLPQDVCRHLREREWNFNRLDGNTIFLIHESGAYGVGVEAEDIDWSGPRGI
jgi:hypothetical protein